MSRLFLRTLRDDPADAEIDSHRLLLRAGCIRRVASGIYAWLPLGRRVLARVEADRPRGDGRRGRPGDDPAHRAAARAVGRSGRDAAYGPLMFRLHGPQGSGVLPVADRGGG